MVNILISKVTKKKLLVLSMSNLLALAILLLSSTPAPTAGDQSFCNDAPYKRDSTYMSNLRSLAGALIGDAARLHSATGAAGKDPDRVYGAVLCRADSAGADCARRLRDALAAIDGDGRSPCALHRGVAVYSELYQLRFSDRKTSSPTSATRKFDEWVTEMLSAVVDAAARRPGRWAVGKAPWSSSGDRDRTVYGLAQCTRDMPPDHCRACLDGVVADRRREIGSGKMGPAVFGARCTLRHDMDLQFFNVTGNSKMVSLGKFLPKHYKPEGRHACYQDELFLKPPRIQLAPRSRVNQSGVHIGTPKVFQKLSNPINDHFVYHVHGRRKTVRSSSLPSGFWSLSATAR